MEKIPGPALCGFADYFDDDAVVGAGKPRKPPPKPPKGKPGAASAAVPRPYPKAKQSAAVATHAKALKNARQVLAKAHGQVKTAAKRAIAKPVAPVSKKVSRNMSARVLVHGDEYFVVGANVIPPAQQPKVKAAVAKLQAAKANVKKLAAAAVPKIKAAHASVVKLATQVKTHENIARKLSGKGGTRGIHGMYGDYVGADPSNPPDPEYPGYLMDGSPDPAFVSTDPTATDTGYTDPTSGAPANAAVLDVDTLVAAANAAPIPINTFIPDTAGLPVIMYNGAKGTPDGYVLSYGLATRDTDVYCEPGAPGTIDGTAHFGYCWKTYPERVGGIPWGEDMGKEGRNHLHGRHWESEGGWSTPCSSEEAFASNSKVVDVDLPGARVRGYISGVARNASYGPLIGNPKMPDFVNLRVDAKGSMFWLANEAPDYITAPLKAAAALTAAAAAKAQKDADAAAAAAAAKTAADNAAALAAQNAQNALDEANAASQGRQVTSQAQATADTADAAAAQADAQAAAADAQAAAADAAQRQADAQAAAAQYQQDMVERQWQFQQDQQQAQQDQQQYRQQQQYQQQQQQQYAQQQQAPQEQYVDDGADGGGTGGDGDTFSSEGQAGGEALSIEDAAEVLGQVLGQPTIAGEDAVIGGDGEAIGLDQFGNLQD